jgi:hypothetical protein
VTLRHSSGVGWLVLHDCMLVWYFTFAQTWYAQGF